MKRGPVVAIGMKRETLGWITLVALAAALPAQPSLAEAAPCGPLRTVEGATGLVAAPEGIAPHSLVLILKGVDHTAADHAPFAARIAQHGAFALAMDYPDFAASYAAAATGAQAWAILDANPTIDRVIAFGISGGLPATTLLLTEGWTKPDCSPLVDVLFDVEGVANLAETYAEARAAFAAVPAAGPAVAEIEAECGSPADAACLAQRSLVANGADADLALDAAAVFQAVNDGLVPVNQGLEATAVLRAEAPTDLTIFLRNDPAQSDDSDTQASEYATAPAGLPDLPLAGHASENDLDHVLVRVAQAALVALLDGGALPEGNVFVVDGEIGTLG